MNLFIIFNFLIGLSIYWANGQTTTRNQDEWYKEQWPAQPYAFGYEIRDYSGNEQYRKEMSDGDRVTGSYGYLGPDGLYRHVEYVADINGFRAKIRTSEPGTGNDNPSNVQIESNPILILPNPAPIGPVPVRPVPVSPGVITPAYGGPTSPNPGQGFRRDGIRRPPERPQINPNRSTYANGSPPSAPLPPPRIPEPPRGPNTLPPIDDRRSINVDQFNVNSGPQVSGGPQPIKPNFEDPTLRGSPIDPTRGRPNGGPTGVTYADIPDNIIPYGGAKPRQDIDGPPRELPRFNDQRQNQGSAGPPARPPYAARLPPIPPNRPSAQPYDRGYDRSGVQNRDQDYDRGRPIGGPEDRRYEVTTKGGPTKLPPQEMGFIEATKGPISPFRPQDKFYDRDSAVFDDDSEYDDQFKRRQDNDKNIVVVSKPVYEDRDGDRDRNRDRVGDRDRNRDQDRDRDRDGPRKIGGFVRSRYNTTRSDSRSGVKTVGVGVGPPPPTIRDSYNRTLNGSAFDANQGRRDGIDKRVRRPTKVFVTSGPIPDRRVPPIKGYNTSFGAIDVQQRQQHIDIDYDNKDIRDGQQIDSDGFKGQTDRDRPLPPIQREEIPQNVRPYYGARRDGSRDSVPKRPQSVAPPPRQPSHPYDPRDEQQHIQTPDEEIPGQRYDDDQQQRQGGPQIFQPLMPNHRPDRQPLPRRPETRPYRPRTRNQDRTYDEQSIEVQPYQTQNSASITSPVNTIPTAYKPVDHLEDDKPLKPPKEDEKPFEKPSFNTPLSPSSYIVTPFPINETKIQIKPIIVSRPEVYTLAPEIYTQISQMEIPKFGTRLYIPQPPTQQVYEAIDQTLDDDKVDQQKDFNYNNDGSDDQNYDQNEYQNEDQNNDQNLNPTDNPTENPIDDQNLNPKQYDNIENDQYYYYDDQTQDVDSKDSSKDVIFTQTEAHKSDENLTINPNNSVPIEMTQKITNFMNWHKYDSGGTPPEPPLNQ